MRRPVVLTFALVLALVALFGSGSALRSAQDATPAADRRAGANQDEETRQYNAQGVSVEIIGRTPSLARAAGRALVLSRLYLSETADVPEREYADAEVLVVEDGTVSFTIVAVQGPGRLVRGQEGAECSGEGCNLNDFVGQEVVLEPGDSLTHDGPVTYGFRYAGPAGARMAPGNAQTGTAAAVLLRGCAGGCR